MSVHSATWLVSILNALMSTLQTLAKLAKRRKVLGRECRTLVAACWSLLGRRVCRCLSTTTYSQHECNWNSKKAQVCYTVLLLANQSGHYEYSTTETPARSATIWGENDMDLRSVHPPKQRPETALRGVSGPQARSYSQTMGTKKEAQAKRNGESEERERCSVRWWGFERGFAG